MVNIVKYNSNFREQELEQIQNRYAKRAIISPDRYSMLNPAVYMGQQEKERKLIKWIKWAGMEPVEMKKVLEIGCGSGTNLLKLVQLGFNPENLIGNELLHERVNLARKLMPSAIKIIAGDALLLDFEDDYFDIVFQSTVFTSILNDEFQKKLSERMWRWVKPGGGILWYDFIYNNPNNPDVRGVSIKRLKALFPSGKFKIWRLTLAPPISRFVTKIHHQFYNVFNMFPFLRSHILCWIKKDK
jgi:ubiquinone/menaquinone biosynthesis C-methylase UbiE